ncbi:MAG: hypothetical protein ACKVP2_07245 [Burkholderiales bacterium]
MIKRAKDALTGVVITLMAVLIGACSSGPSESEFVAACLKEGENVASKRLDKEMGVNRDTFCKCAAREAKSMLSSDAQRAMILDMEGKKQEASAVSSKMSESEQMAFMKGAIDVFGKCTGAK